MMHKDSITWQKSDTQDPDQRNFKFQDINKESSEYCPDSPLI